MGTTEFVAYCESIAKLYGVELRWVPEGGGCWESGTNIIYVPWIDQQPKNETIRIFCHEFGHYINFVEGKYPIYHCEKNAKAVRRKFKTYAQRVAYAHRAEVYTEKRGKELAAFLFPETKYVDFYKSRDKRSRDFLTYYFDGVF